MDQTVNPYLRDAPYFLQRAVAGIVDEKDGAENLTHALDLALGIERVLKGILWKEHPGYTLADERFQNMAAVFQADNLKKIGIDKEKGNADSITYRTAATRARIFSNATHDQFAVLMKLGYVRDVVVHNDLTQIDLKELTFFLRRNLHPILTAFTSEKLIDGKQLMGKNETLVAKMAIDYIEDLRERVAKRLAHHLEIFRRRQAPIEYALPAIAPARTDQMDTRVECPACCHEAYVREEVDFDIVDRQAVPMGMFISHLHCPHCRLFVEDYEELKEMGITMSSLHPPDDDL